VLLLITGSLDGSSDLICKELGNKVFRFNYDIFNEYTLEFSPDHWKITNPVGHSITSTTVTSCFWWKAFNFPIENQDKFVVDEVKYIFRELYAWCRLRGLVKGNSIDFHNEYGKINLLDIASKYFLTPKTLVTFKCAGLDSFYSEKLVAKSLTSTLTSNMGSLLTTEVEKSKLHPDFPWFLQEKVVSDFDITVFVCGEKLYAYEKDRKNLKGLDWRGEQTFDINNKEWIKFGLNEVEAHAIKLFCDDINVNWGRLDFMREKDKLVFLEFNANGQWVFLDYSGEDGLLGAVTNFLLPNTN
jgi:hypothetical protein